MSGGPNPPECFPPPSEFGCIKPKLTEGEACLAEFLYRNLQPPWRIYVQPKVNKIEPDIVALHPEWGLIVYEVKDWNLSIYERRGDKSLRVLGDPRSFSLDPRTQAHDYARRFFEQFLGVEESTRKLDERSNDWQVCLSVAYLHGQDRSEVERLFGKYSWGEGTTNLVLCTGDLDRSDALARVVPWTGYRRDRSQFITDAQVQALRELHRFLGPREPLKTKELAIQLTERQARLAEPSVGYERIRGAAGSGKSLLLAIRAARASHQGPVLVVCFNITMANWISDQVHNCGSALGQDVVVRHFHGLLHDWSLHWPDSKTLWPGPSRESLERFLGWLRDQENSQHYRGIYIDEGQDFEAHWVDFLAAFRAENGELVFAADYKQGIYRRLGAADGRSLKVAKFPPGWRQLTDSHRLPARVILLLNEFTAEVARRRQRLGDEEDAGLAPAPMQASLFHGSLHWENCNSLDDAIGRALHVASNCPYHPGDCAVLVRTHETGLQFVRKLESKDGRFTPVQHIFSEQGSESEESTRRKHAFWFGRGPCKACTIHSFKGWEIGTVVVIWERHGAADEVAAAALYVALSRTTKHLVVFNIDRQFDWVATLSGWDRNRASVPAE